MVLQDLKTTIEKPIHSPLKEGPREHSPVRLPGQNSMLFKIWFVELMVKVGFQTFLKTA